MDLKKYKAYRIFEGMESNTFNLVKSKTVHFIRHGHGFHNAAGELDHSGYLLEENEDAALTPLGVKQCADFSSTIQSQSFLKSAQVILLSPMRRTIQTATYCFPLLMNKIPWLGIETLRERSGLHPCDRRLSISTLSRHYPHIDFSLVQEDKDPLYYVYPREPDEVLDARCRKFMIELSNRPEMSIIVVGHSSYLDQLFTEIVEVPNATEKYTRFNNCEMRSFVVDLE